MPNGRNGKEAACSMGLIDTCSMGLIAITIIRNLFLYHNQCQVRLSIVSAMENTHLYWMNELRHQRTTTLRRFLNFRRFKMYVLFVWVDMDREMRIFFFLKCKIIEFDSSSGTMWKMWKMGEGQKTGITNDTIHWLMSSHVKESKNWQTYAITTESACSTN